MSVAYETGYWLVLSRLPDSLECQVYRTPSRREAEYLADDLKRNGEDARVVPEMKNAAAPTR